MEMFWFEVSVSEAPLYGLSERALFGMPFGTFLKDSPPSLSPAWHESRVARHCLHQVKNVSVPERPSAHTQESWPPVPTKG